MAGALASPLAPGVDREKRSWFQQHSQPAPAAMILTRSLSLSEGPSAVADLDKAAIEMRHAVRSCLISPARAHDIC